VGESEHFVQDGGIIGFLLEENKIRFEINLDAAEHAKLKVSSRLLALAKTVIGVTEGREMLFIRNASIQRKLTLVIFFVSVLGLSMTCLAFEVYERAIFVPR